MFNSYWTSIVIIILAFAVVFVYVYISGGRYEAFKKNGIKTEAKILSKEKIGASGTGNTKFRVIVEFLTQTGRVTATTKRYFTPEDLVKVLKRNTVIIYYLPTVPKKIQLAPEEMESYLTF